MATSLTFNPYENDDRTRLLDNYHYLAERRCLKQRAYHAPLALRRSISLEESSTDPDLNLLQKPNPSNLLGSTNPQITSSLNSLCLQLRRYQLLPEHNEDIARSSDESHFNWWKTAAHLRPILEKIIMSDQRKSHSSPETFEDESEITFKDCKRQKRRNAVCLEVDRLCYNDQLILFATIANEVQLEFNLMSTGYKI